MVWSVECLSYLRCGLDMRGRFLQKKRTGIVRPFQKNNKGYCCSPLGSIRCPCDRFEEPGVTEIGFCRRNVSKDSGRSSTCCPRVIVFAPAPAPAPAVAPIAAPFPPPKIPPRTAPTAAPPATLPAVFFPRAAPCFDH